MKMSGSKSLAFSVIRTYSIVVCLSHENGGYAAQKWPAASLMLKSNSRTARSLSTLLCNDMSTMMRSSTMKCPGCLNSRFVNDAYYVHSQAWPCMSNLLKCTLVAFWSVKLLCEAGDCGRRWQSQATGCSVDKNVGDRFHKLADVREAAKQLSQSCISQNQARMHATPEQVRLVISEPCCWVSTEAFAAIDVILNEC